MIELVSIELKSTHEGNVQREPIVSGIPFSRGKLRNVETLQLVDASEEVVPAHCHATAKWPDGSIKWLLIYFQVVAKMGDRGSLSLRANKSSSVCGATSDGDLSVIEDNSGKNITVDTGNARFRIRGDHLGPFEQVVVAGNDRLSGHKSGLIMKDATGRILRSRILSITCGDESNRIQRTLTLRGNFCNSDDDLVAEFAMRLTFFSSLACVRIDCSLLNPGAAEHPKGQWDLGDNGSVLFRSLKFEISLFHEAENLSSYLKPEPDSPWQKIHTDNFRLYQDSSGGDNWQSDNHINANNEVPVRFRGYKLVENNVEKPGGLRADPLLRLCSTGMSFGAYVKDFWQNFPNAIQVDGNIVRLHLFPDYYSDVFELQGGEQKTHTFFLDFSENSDALAWSQSPRYIEVSSTHIARAGVMPFLAERRVEDGMQDLINAGLTGEYNFFAKREVIDEFGWRNFGDVYADHEELNYSGEVPLISHYNNQYDALDGFLRQYLVTTDRRWFDLAAPLAQHIIDIDIYNTTDDRGEYNGGLFWHTDHYLNAFSSTHRTYSSSNAFSYDGESGGGPGTEHCYTAGLTNFFFLTGDRRYRDAALQLARWIERSMEGSDSVLERVWQFFRRDISTIKKLLSGQTVPKHAYPLSRATGNYLSTILDAFDLTEERRYLEQAESIIRGTFHPNDDIAHRGLEDIETGWSYLIFLQAVTKYMFVKSASGETDESFHYARDSFLHYADWVLEQEQPFLANSDQLDFPNLTWVAQDLRKAYVLQIASCFRSRNKGKYLDKSMFYRKYVTENLDGERQGQYARILVILMQNNLPELEPIESVLDGGRAPVDFSSYGEAPKHSLVEFLMGTIVSLLKRLLRLSLREEIRWFKYRVKT